MSPMSKLSYSSANFGKSMFWTSMELFFLFYLTDILEIHPATAGLIVLIGLVWDGITDPIVGYLIDSLKYKIPKYGTYLLFGAPLTSISFVLLFAPIQMDQTCTVYFVLAVSLLFRTFYSLLDVPHNSMLASLTPDSRTRSDLASLRYFFSSLGGVVVSLGISSSLINGSMGKEPKDFFIYSLIASLLALLSLYACYFGTIRLEKELKSNNSKATFKAILRSVSNNKQLWIAFLLMSLSSLTLPLFGKAVIYYSKYIHGDESIVGSLLVLLALGKGGAIPLWMFVTRKIGKKWSAIFAYGSTCIALSLFWLGSNYSEQSLYFLTVFIGITMSGTAVINWAIIPDTVDFGEWRSGIRAEGFIFGFFTLTSKISMGVGAAMFGIILGAQGFQPNAEQSSNVINSILNIMCLVPIVGGLLCIFCLRYYRLSFDLHERIIKTLHKRSK
jgi:GPH family glycoside/pentoside/hexuronide:cation symporter